MPETFTTRQLAVIAATNKIVTWLFRVTDNLGTEYHWSTGTVAAGTGSITIGAQESPSIWTHGEWDTAHTFKIVNFNGITLRRSKSEYGINAPNDVSFSIVNGSNTLIASNFKGGTVRIALVVDDGNGKEVVGSWRFVIKSASPYNQQIDVTCEDFLQQYLRGTYPNTRLISEIFPANTDNTIIKDNVCVPEVYGTAYVPLRSVYAGSARYYLLGPATDKTYTITEVRNPRATGAKITWTSPTFAMTQSTQSTWRVFQPIIAASTGGGAVDSPGLWENGDTFWDIPTKFSEAGTLTVTNPADVIRRVLLNMGLMDYDLNGASFDTARTTFTSWGLEWNFAFYYKEDRAKVLSKLLAMCHCCLVIGEQVSLQVLSAASVKTLTAVEVTKPDETGPSSFRYTDSLAEKVSDSGYVAWQQTGESQDLFLKAKVPAKSATDYPDSETIELPGVQDSQKIQKLGTLYYQRKLLKSADISANLKGTCLIVRPDDVVTVNYADFGGTYNVLVDEATIKPDASMDIRAIKFSEVLDDWADLAPAAITVATDSTTNTYSPVYAGPDSPGSTNLPNALPGRLRIGQTTNYILLDPNSPLRISLYSSDVERMRFGNLNGFLDYVTNLYGLAVGDATNYMKYDTTNGLRISGAISAGTIDIGGADASSFHVDVNGNMWLGAATYDIATNPFAVSNAGVLRAVSGTIGGWTLGTTSFTGTGITLSSTGDAYLAIGTTPPTSPTAGTGIFINKTGLFGLNANNPRFKILEDGSGFLGASDVIGWTSAGVVTIAGFTTGNTDLTKTSGGNTTIVSSGATAFTAGPTGSPTFTVTQAGVLTATGVIVTGEINASTGKIGGATNYWNITAGTITSVLAGSLVMGSAGSTLKLGAATDIDTGIGLFANGAGDIRVGSATAGTERIKFASSVLDIKSSTFNLLASTAGHIGLTATTYALGDGVWLSSTATTRFRVGNAAASRMQWNDVDLQIYNSANALVASFGGTNSIAGWSITTTSLQTGAFDTAGTMYFGTSGISLADTFKVTAAGVLTCTGATISGAITATSGTFTGAVNATSGKFGTSTNYWSVGATGLTATSASTDVIINYGKTDFDNTVSGFILGYDFSASKAKFYVGDATSYLNWDGAALTYTKGTLIETIIQMYTSVASLATSATAGDGSANSAGIKITYEGLFGCGANQTATVAAANANVRILATGAAILTDVTLTTSAANAITVNYGSNVLLKEGGSLRFTSVAAPGACTATLVTTGTGNVTNGSHEYGITFVTATGETELGSLSNAVIVDASHKQVDLTNIPVSSSPAVTSRKIYRNVAGGPVHFYLATISNNTATTYTDNIADGSLGTYSWDTRQNDTFGKIINDSIEVFSVGSTNTLVGYNTAAATNLGKNITFIGANAGYSNTIGGALVAVGGNALYYNITGSYNACVGYASLNKATASGNAAIGAYSGWAITSGTNNVFLGYGAGQNSQLATATNSIAIGYNTATSASNQIVLGNSSIVETLLQGNILIGITAVGTSAAKVLGIGSGTTPTTAPANIAQLWVEDINAAAGYAGFHMRVETNNTKLVVPGVAIKTDAGQTANPFEGLIEINTNENKIYMYAEAGWRQLATW